MLSERLNSGVRGNYELAKDVITSDAASEVFAAG